MFSTEKLLIGVLATAALVTPAAYAAKDSGEHFAIPPAPLIIQPSQLQSPFVFPNPLMPPQSTAPEQRVPESHAQGEPNYQPFICDESGAGSGSASFVSSLRHLSLSLSVGDNSQVIVGANFGNVQGLPPKEIVIDYRGQANSTFGPFLLLSYYLPNAKLSGRVVPFMQAKNGKDAPEGYTRAIFRGQDLELPEGATIQSMEMIGIGENGGGSVTIGDVTVNGAAASKLLSTQNTCDFVP
ncbi:MAG TPA: hypothetical protein V6C81_16130 [Planktothrix sp.]